MEDNLPSDIDYNLEKVCRSCLTEEGEMRNVFMYEETLSPNINEMLMACAQVQIMENDGMPAKICEQCISEVNHAYTFKQRCERSDATLRDYITRKHPNIKLAPNIKQELYGNDDFHLPIKPEITIVESDPLIENFYDGSGDNNYDNSDGEVIPTHKRSKRTRRGRDSSGALNNIKLNKTKLSPFECDYCDKILVDAKGLLLHTRLHTGEHLKHCGICNRGFAKMSHLNRHITSMHSDDNDVEVKQEPLEVSSATPDVEAEKTIPQQVTKGKYKCQFCDASFSVRKELSVHIVSHEVAPRKRGRPSRRDLQLRLQKQAEQKRLDKLGDSDFDSDKDDDKPLAKIRDGNNEEDDEDFEIKTEIKSEPKDKEFGCTMCEKEFQTYEGLEVHMRKHTGDKLAVCKICNKEYTRKNHLKRHIMTHCNANTFRDVELKVRPDLFDDPITDDDTEETLIDKIIQMITDGNVNKFVQVTSTSGTELFTESESSASEGEQGKKTVSSRKGKLHYCSICNAGFSRTNHIIRHMSVHNNDYPFKCTVCEKVFPNDEILQKHLRSQCNNTTKPYTCKVCKLKFMWESSLLKHETKHLTSSGHLDKSFKTPKEPKEKSFLCSMCNKAFYRAEHLDRHMKTHMVSERKFECTICQKKFNRKDNLRSHQRVHKEEKEDCDKHLCVYCGRSFSNSSNLIVHMRRHTGEKPYRCDICNKGFPRSSDLQCHRRTHTGEKPCLCTICGKGFSRSNKLVRHMRIHTGQRPYKCTFCDRAFTQSNDLTLHIRRHTGDKPYVCGICGDRFIQGTALQAHRRMQGHYEELNQPTPFASISCNNPNRYNNPNRVNRIGGAPPSPPPMTRIITPITSTANITTAVTSNTTQGSTTVTSNRTSNMSHSQSSSTHVAPSSSSIQAGSLNLSNSVNNLAAAANHRVLSGFAGGYVPNGVPFLSNTGVLMQNLDVSNALSNIPLFSISQYNQGYN